MEKQRLRSTTPFFFLLSYKPINASSEPQGLLVYVAVSGKEKKLPGRHILSGAPRRCAPGAGRLPTATLPISLDPGTSQYPAPEKPRAPWRPSGGACGPPLTPVPQVAPRLLAGHARPSARSSGCPERKEVALGGGGERSRSHPDAGVQPRRKAEMAAKPGLGYLRRSRSAGVVSAVGRLQTPRRRCQATVRREEGSRVCGEEGLRWSAWDAERGRVGGRPRARRSALQLRGSRRDPKPRGRPRR